MATVHVTLSRVDDRGDTGGSLPIITSVPDEAQTIVSSNASAPSTIAAAKADGLVWAVASTGNVWVKFGAAPDAASGKRHLVLAGQTFFASVTAAGEKIAVMDA